MRRSLRLTVPLLLLAAVTAPPARATTMVGRSVEDLARAAESVVRATTLSTRAAWDAGRRNIVTTVRLRAVESLAGGIAPGSEFELQHYGGIADKIEMTVIGAPRFAPGEDVVLFVRRDARGALGTIDLAQGKLEVTRDASGAERLTRRDLEGVEWAKGVGPDRVEDLATLRARVRAALRSGR
jgi:hypothetical protein